MFNRVRAYGSRIFRRGVRFSDLFLGVIGQPRLALASFRQVTRRRARILESNLNLAENRKAPVPKQTVRMDRNDLIGALAERFGIFLLAEQPDHVRLGVAEVDFLSVLHWLARNAQSAQIKIAGKSVSFATKDFKTLALAAQEVRLHYVTSNLDGDLFAIEPYFRHGPSKWISPNPGNSSARAIYDDRLETPGLTRLVDLLAAPSFAAAVADRPIDLVYTWVNHADPDWAATYSRYKQALSEGANLDELGLSPIKPQPKSADATALSRFHSNDELRYSLRSVAKNLPWVRQIYVFTNCAPPDWLKTSHPGVRWVQHHEVIPEQFLPTFSSHVIESFLHRIPMLADQFIYMNDDVFIGSPLKKAFFFENNGCSRSLLEPYGMVSGDVKEGDPDYLNASRNSAALIRDAFGFAPTQLHRHTSFALRRDVLAEIEARWPDRFEDLRHNRFRTGHDLNVTSFLYHHYGLATGRVRMAEVKNAFIKSQDIRWRSQLSQIERNKPEVICINEGGDAAPSNDWHATVQKFLHSQWPHAAPWEK